MHAGTTRTHVKAEAKSGAPLSAKLQQARIDLSTRHRMSRDSKCVIEPEATTPALFFFFFSSRRRHTRCSRDWSSDVCSSDLWLSVAAGDGLGERYKSPRTAPFPPATRL